MKTKTLEHKMIGNTFTHLQFMGYMTLRDRFGFGRKRLLRYWDNISSLFEQYNNDDVSVKQMMEYCNVKGINYKKYVKDIPQSQRIKLSEYKSNRGGNALDLIKVVDSPITAYFLLSSIVLREELEFSIPQIDKFASEIKYYVDSYVRGYLNDTIVNDIMIEECKLDIKEGKA